MSVFLPVLRKLWRQRVVILTRIEGQSDQTVKGKIVHVDPHLCLVAAKGTVHILHSANVVNITFPRKLAGEIDLPKPRRKAPPFFPYLRQLVGKHTMLHTVFHKSWEIYTGKLLKVMEDICFFAEAGEDEIAYCFATDTVTDIVCDETDLTIYSEVHLEEIK